MAHDQDPLIAQALAQGCTQAEAGRRAGVSERTVRRRLEDPRFRAMVTEARDRLIKETADRFTSLQSSALDAIEGALNDPRADTRLRAAKMVLDIGGQYRDRAELEARLQAVEAGVTDTEPVLGLAPPAREDRPEAATTGQQGDNEETPDELRHTSG